MAPLAPDLLDLLARGGQAVDVVVAGPGAARPPATAPLRAWTAAGGVLICTTVDEADALADGAALADAPTGIAARPSAQGGCWGRPTPRSARSRRSLERRTTRSPPHAPSAGRGETP